MTRVPLGRGARASQRPSGRLDAIAKAEEPAPVLLGSAAHAVVGDLDGQHALRERRTHMDRRGLRMLLRVGGGLAEDVVGGRLRALVEPQSREARAAVSGSSSGPPGSGSHLRGPGARARSGGFRARARAIRRAPAATLPKHSSGDRKPAREPLPPAGRRSRSAPRARAGVAERRHAGCARCAAARCRPSRSRARGRHSSCSAIRSRSDTTAARHNVVTAATAMKSCVPRTSTDGECEANGPA